MSWHLFQLGGVITTVVVILIVGCVIGDAIDHHTAQSSEEEPNE